MLNDMYYVFAAFVATVFTWGCTALGAAVVFIFGKAEKRVQNCMLGFSAGVMTAASFWSLLNPAVVLSSETGMNASFVTLIGFSAGVFLLLLKEALFENKDSNADNNRVSMLIFSITLHNIPEGLAVGVAFGSIAYSLEGSSMSAACMLALGIGIQNIPEGSAVSLPMRSAGYSKKKAFFYGQMSAFVEVIAGVFGAFTAGLSRNVLPFLLSFAAGAMIYVAFRELIPESQQGRNKSTVTMFSMLGFALMTFLDIALG